MPTVSSHLLSALPKLWQCQGWRPRKRRNGAATVSIAIAPRDLTDSCHFCVWSGAGRAWWVLVRCILLEEAWVEAVVVIVVGWMDAAVVLSGLGARLRRLVALQVRLGEGQCECTVESGVGNDGDRSLPAADFGW